MNKPNLLFYCQHSLGMGHLVRSFRLSQALAKDYRIVFINGGPIPQGIEVPDTIELVNIPPLGMSADCHSLISRDERYTLVQARQVRLQVILQLRRKYKPEVILIELFPFGRKKFADELIPLLKAAEKQSSPPRVFCSLRDILVRNRDDQIKFENRASTLLNRYFDAVFLHCDPAFATLEQSFRPEVRLQIPVYNTGFIAPPISGRREKKRIRRIIVSAGGGIVGNTLFRTAIKAQPEIWLKTKMPMIIVAGPFLPDDEWQALNFQAENIKGLILTRTVPGLMPFLVKSEISISQCGYNTAMELIQSRIKALVIPFQIPGEDEQMNRARRLEKSGAISLLDPQQLNRSVLAQAVIDLHHTSVSHPVLDTDGAENTRRVMRMLMDQVQPAVVSA